MRRAGFAAIVLSALLPMCLLATARSAAADESLPSVGRVLVIALPGVTWADVEHNDLPAIRSIVEGSALANLAVRVERQKTDVADGYATVGSGTRAVAHHDDAGLAFDAREPFEADDAAAAYRRITGHRLAGAAAQLRFPGIESANKKSVFHAKVAALGDVLAPEGVTAGVIANADTAIRPVGNDLTSYHREAALALIDSTGQLPCGALGPELLTKDAAAPFGIALDPNAVDRAFATCWRDHSVVLVEGSDLQRTEQYETSVAKAQYDTLWREALQRTDRLVARVLRRVDPARDAVVLVAPSAPQATKPALTLFAVRAPGLEAGLLESGVTRQGGYVSIVDVAPTIATLAHAPLDEAKIEGRPVSVSRRGGDAAGRIAFLVDGNANAQFRDHLMSTFIPTFITITLLTALAATVSIRLRRRWRWLEPLALGTLAVMPLTYWSALLPFARWGTAAYFAFTFLGGLMLGLLADLTRRWFKLPIILVMSFMLATTAISIVLLDSRLQLSTVFGDSPIVAGRFSGINNVTFSQVILVTILLAGFIRTAFARFGTWLVLAFFIAVALLDGAPMWGAKVGATLAGVPALALTWTLLRGRRVRIRTVATWVLVTFVVIVGLGLLDLTRDPSHRTHLGRLFESIGNNGSTGFRTIVHRKLDANLATLTSSVWRYMFVPVGVFAAYVMLRAPERIAAIRARLPMFDKCLIGIGAAALLGDALNDSGIAVPGVILAAFTLVMVYLLNRVDGTVEDAEEIADARAPDRVAERSAALIR